MTMDNLKFDEDSHESSEHWFGMTVLFDALTFLYKFQFAALLRSDTHILLSPPARGVWEETVRNTPDATVCPDE